jgi:hypothetical protein
MEIPEYDEPAPLCTEEQLQLLEKASFDPSIVITNPRAVGYVGPADSAPALCRLPSIVVPIVAPKEGELPMYTRPSDSGIREEDYPGTAPDPDATSTPDPTVTPDETSSGPVDAASLLQPDSTYRLCRAGGSMLLF